MSEMRQIEISKVVLNVGAGENRDKVEKGYELLKKLSGEEPVRTKSGQNMKTFGGQTGQTIGTKVTLRGKKAVEFLQKAVDAADGLDSSNLDGNGNLSFGIDEYIDIPGVEYDGDIGMMGLEIAVKTERPGYRVQKRDHRPKRIGKNHRVTDDEAMEFFQQNVGVDL